MIRISNPFTESGSRVGIGERASESGIEIGVWKNGSQKRYLKQ